MKEVFEIIVKEMGGYVDVEVNVMYLGFKFVDGDYVVEVVKCVVEKIGCIFFFY